MGSFMFQSGYDSRIVEPRGTSVASTQIANATPRVPEREQNGRVFLGSYGTGGLGGSSAPSDYDKQVFELDSARELVTGIAQSTALSDVYFSKMNIAALQATLRAEVFALTKKRIGRQNEAALIAVMRGMFAQYANARQGAREIGTSQELNEILEETRRVNAIVIGFCVPRVVGEIAMRDKYLNDISKLPDQLPRPTATSSVGTRSDVSAGNVHRYS